MPDAKKSWSLGLILTLLSIFFWGAQPVLIAIVALSLPSTALAFYKIFTAAVALTLFLLLNRAFPDFRGQGRRPLVLLVGAALSLALSYVLYNSCFRFITPANAGVFIQLSRILMALGGIYVFKEKFVRLQWLGLVVIIGGLALFFHDQVDRGGGDYIFGVTLVIASAICWAAYATLQKLLLVHFSAQATLVFIYLFSSVLLAPYAEFKPLTLLHGLEWLALAFICLTNVLAFATFSEALNHWEASKVGALSCLTPFVTIGLLYCMGALAARVLRPEMLGMSALAGAALVVSGSILVTVF